MCGRAGVIKLCVLALCLFAAASVTAKTSGFRWLQPEDPLWTKIQSDFQQILFPDDADQVAPASYRFRRILRIGLFRATALVLISYCDNDINRARVGSSPCIHLRRENVQTLAGRVDRVLALDHHRTGASRANPNT